MATLTLSENLKDHTQKIHLELEESLIYAIQNIRSPSQYTALLKVFYGFYFPLEKQLTNVPGIEYAMAGMKFRKADSIPLAIFTNMRYIKN